jgi:FKBP-type peptidyl-prolyl cis-trans isomerase
MKKLLLLPFLFISCIALAQYKTLPNGIQYRIVKKGSGKRLPKMNDFISCKIKGTLSGKTVFSTKELNKGVDNFMNFQIVPRKYNGDMLLEALKVLSDGDSAVFLLPQDSVFGGTKPPFAKVGEKVFYTVSVLSVLSPAELKKAQELQKKQQADFAKQQLEFKKMNDLNQKKQAEFKKQQAAAKGLIAKEAKTIAQYVANNGWTNAVKTKSGLYIAVTQPGSGDLPSKGDEMTMNYTGQLLNGTKFDSNVDTAFGHVSPFNFPLGQGRVIAGWDEAVATLSKGSKATILIPSALGYGPTGSGANILPNSPLRFDIEVLDFKRLPTAEEMAQTDEKIITDYLSINNINATKTNSGLYYVVTTAGQGATPKLGEEVNMNYTGRLVNGDKFDSNIDSAFNHVAPFKFPVGQGRVIKGWDEGISLLPKGSKATLFIPSGLAYAGGSPSPKIPANSVLFFDVEVVDIIPAPPTPPSPPAPPAPQMPPMPKKPSNKK